MAIDLVVNYTGSSLLASVQPHLHESYIRRLLKVHGWDNPSPRETSNKPKPPLHESDVATLFSLAAGPVENVEGN